MSEDNVLSFFARVKRPVVPPPPTTAASGKFGVYPLGSDDVIVALQVYSTIVDVLESGSPENRTQLAQHLRESYCAYYR